MALMPCQLPTFSAWLHDASVNCKIFATGQRAVCTIFWWTRSVDDKAAQVWIACSSKLTEIDSSCFCDVFNKVKKFLWTKLASHQTQASLWYNKILLFDKTNNTHFYRTIFSPGQQQSMTDITYCICHFFNPASSQSTRFKKLISSGYCGYGQPL